MKKLIKGLIAFTGVCGLGIGSYIYLNTVTNSDLKNKMAIPEQQKHQPLEIIAENTPVIEVIDSEDNCKTFNNSNYLFQAQPIEAGQSSELIIMGGLNSRKSPDSIEKIVLFEDGNEISTMDGGYFAHTVVQENKSSHTYSAELHTKSGKKIETNDIEIAFTGDKIDFMPSVKSFLSLAQEAGNSTFIMVEGKDIGDNKGIKRVTLFEDGEPLETVIDTSRILRTIQYNSPQIHEYHAEIEDKGNQIVTTKKITVDYSGEAFQPSVSWFLANPQDAGRTTDIVVSGKDDENYGDLKGISRIILYEDGQQIHEENKGSLFFQLTHDKEGSHEYRAEIYNKNNKVLTTEPLTVNFTGKDFPPEISSWLINYKPEEGLATILAAGKDKKNVRDDAGIRQIVLFENNNPIKKVKSSTLLTELIKPDGEYTYFAEIVNNSGLTTRTDDIVVKYLTK